MKAASAPKPKPLLPVRTQDWTPVPSTGKVLFPETPKSRLRGHDLDSRLQQPKLTSDGTLERMFCVSCGAPSGWVTTEVVKVATYVCSECTTTHGALALPRIDIPE